MLLLLLLSLQLCVAPRGQTLVSQPIYHTASDFILCRTTCVPVDCDDELIDGAVYRVSDQLFSASSCASGNPPHSAREGSGSWCTENIAVSDSPWLGVRFGVNVRIQGLGTAGIGGIFSSEYVSSYQVQYAKVGEHQLRYITNEQNDTIPMVRIYLLFRNPFFIAIITLNSQQHSIANPCCQLRYTDAHTCTCMCHITTFCFLGVWKRSKF